MSMLLQIFRFLFNYKTHFFFNLILLFSCKMLNKINFNSHLKYIVSSK